MQREGHESEIINMVRTSLVDGDATVKTALAKAFDTLQEHIGARAIDQMIPTLLEASVYLARAQGRPSLIGRSCRQVVVSRGERGRYLGF